MTNRDRMEELINGLKQQRDELALKIHLGKKEPQDEWKLLTAKFDDLMNDYQPVKDAMKESAGNLGESLKLVASEIEEGFQKIRKSL